MKKASQPTLFARKPVGAEASTRGTPIRLVSRAYCVAVNFLFVMLAMNAAGRNMTIEVAEYFDRVGFTYRRGNEREIRKPAADVDWVRRT